MKVRPRDLLAAYSISVLRGIEVDTDWKTYYMGLNLIVLEPGNIEPEDLNKYSEDDWIDFEDNEDFDEIIEEK